MLHAVIMAGGAGTRFWPASRIERPKQLLALAGPQTMIQSTVARLGTLVPPQRVLIVTNQRLVAAIQQQLPELPAEAVMGEPCKRDTAPCVGLAAAWVSRFDPDATMAVMPADHVIQQRAEFQTALQQASDLVAASPGRIVTFGIRPTYPAESFGYIERDLPLDSSGAPAFRVKQFREKPSAAVARDYLAAGSFYWNSGIFVWKARTILDQLARHEPEMCGHLDTITRSFGKPQFAETFRREFAAIKGKSIDYAVMERATDIAVIEAPFDWDDVGSWQSLQRLQPPDEHGNTVQAEAAVLLETRGSIIRGTAGHLIATVGLTDCIVVHTPDATLVANKHQEESIRQIVRLLEEKEWQQFL